MPRLPGDERSLAALAFGAFGVLLSACGAGAQDPGPSNEKGMFFSNLAELSAPSQQGARNLYGKILMAERPPYRVQTREIDADGVSCEWFWPARLHYRRGVRAILYVHGGGLFAGSSATHRLIAGNFAKAASSDVLAVNYRLLPEADYPAPRDDVLSAYRWLLYSGYGPSNIAMIGDSFGATLAIAATIRQLESGGAPPAAIVAMSPVLKIPETVVPADTLGSDPLWQLSRIGPDEKARHVLVHEVTRLAEQFPPMLIQVGDQELLFASTRQYAETAKQDAPSITMTTWPDMVHEWQLFPARIDAARRSDQEAAEFVMRHFRDKPQD